MSGDQGIDVLDGGEGADQMTGGLGDDTYYVDNVGDTTIEASGTGSGTDRVYSTISWTLASNIENLSLLGTANINGTGNSSINNITGNLGNNILDGGAGADILAGGLGDDTYIVNSSNDIVTELENAGIDTIQSSASYTLSDHVENLTLTGNSIINGTGNSLDNVILGNTTTNTLDGAGGSDTMMGGLGNDTYIVDSSDDIVVEYTNEGNNDLVQSSVSWILGDHLERLTLTGTSHIDGTGNSLNNIITGNDGNNIIEGGLGNDTMNGGAGIDTLSYAYATSAISIDLSKTASQVTGGAGTDIISNFENIFASAFNDTLKGNSLNNVINGRGGADTMTGGLGADTFIFDDSSWGSADTITDFSVAQGDVLDISSLLFDYDPLQSIIDDYVTFTTVGSNTVVSLDRDGLGSQFSAQSIASLSGVTSLDEQTLLTNGNLIA